MPLNPPLAFRNWRRYCNSGQIVSVREVFQEIAVGPVESLRVWAAAHQEIFTTPTAEEGAFVARIFAVQHFQRNIDLKKLYKGGSSADPFVVAKAFVTQGTVVTMEEHKPNAAKIPNICEHFNIPCMLLEDFMEREGWQF